MSIYRSTGNLAAAQWFWNLQSAGLLGATATVLLFHGGVLRLALWSAAPMIVVTAGAWLSLRRSHPELLPKLSEARIAGLRELLRPEPAVWPHHALNGADLQGPVLLVSHGSVAQPWRCWSLRALLANVAKQMVAPVQVALWPELTRLDAVGAERRFASGIGC